MLKQKIKNLNKRQKIYLGIVVGVIAAVLIQIAIVQYLRARPIVSFTQQWQEHGKPVTVQRVQAGDVDMYSRFTLSQVVGVNATGFVTADIRDKLAVGQELFLKPGVMAGHIISVGRNLDIDTGMFLVKVSFDGSVSGLSPAVSVLAKTGILNNVITVPNSLLDIIDGKYYLWVVKAGKAHRCLVQTGLRNGFGAVIESGLNTGDMLITAGTALLDEGDKLNIEADND